MDRGSPYDGYNTAKMALNCDVYRQGKTMSRAKTEIETPASEKMFAQRPFSVRARHEPKSVSNRTHLSCNGCPMYRTNSSNQKGQTTSPNWCRFVYTTLLVQTCVVFEKMTVWLFDWQLSIYIGQCCVYKTCARGEYSCPHLPSSVFICYFYYWWAPLV